jgi:hypothetical protein
LESIFQIIFTLNEKSGIYFPNLDSKIFGKHVSKFLFKDKNGIWGWKKKHRGGKRDYHSWNLTFLAWYIVLWKSYPHTKNNDRWNKNHVHFLAFFTGLCPSGVKTLLIIIVAVQKEKRIIFFKKKRSD